MHERRWITRWSDVQVAYPNQWLVIEALEAHAEGNQHILDHIAVVKVCPDSMSVMQAYRRLHQQYSLREFYFVHTSRASLDIEERRWVGMDFLMRIGAVINLHRLQLELPDVEA